MGRGRALFAVAQNRCRSPGRRDGFTFRGGDDRAHPILQPFSLGNDTKPLPGAFHEGSIRLLCKDFDGDFGFDFFVDPNGHGEGTQGLDGLGQQDHLSFDVDADFFQCFGNIPNADGAV